MNNTKYNNFVRPSSSPESCSFSHNKLSGAEAQKLYLEEIQDKPGRTKPRLSSNTLQKRGIRPTEDLNLSDKELFLTVQNNDVSKLIEVLDNCPDRVNTVDNFGWSLLMIACQANSVDTVKELLHRGIDVSICDKAGNSAHSLVIRNRNLSLVDLLLNHKGHENPETISENVEKRKKIKFTCEICDNRIFPDKDEHLSSTIHNINASKNKKIPANYAIPSSNKGYQIMLKAGWDRESGLGRDSTGKRYPIKTVPKKDRKGLGNQKKLIVEKEDKVRHKHRRMLNREYCDNRIMEINFRRQFY